MACLLHARRRGTTLVFLALLSSQLLLSIGSSHFGVYAAPELEGFLDESEFEDEEEASTFTVTSTESSSPFRRTADSIPIPVTVENAIHEDAAKKPSKWDEEEFEDLPTTENPATTESIASEVSAKEKMKKGGAKQRKRKLRKTPKGPLAYWPEAVAAILFAVYGLYYLYGMRENEEIALAWAEKFALENSIFEKNFSLLGVGDGKPDEPVVVKETNTKYFFYASGRRYCTGLKATMNLSIRHDFLSALWYKLVPAKNTISFNVLMNEESMDPFILAVVKRKSGKAFQREWKEVKDLCVPVEIASDRRFSTEDLVVFSDSKEAVVEILSEAIIEQLFSEKVFKKLIASYFVSLHFTDQFTGSHKKVLQFEFLLPPKDQMADITRLMACVPHFIDAVGRFRLSPQARSKAEAVRSKLQASEKKDEKKKRMEMLSKKKEEKKKALEAKMTDSQLAKLKEKERLKAMKRSAGKKMVKAV